MAKPFRLAVLECDVPFPGVVEVHGSYGDIFGELLAKGMRDIEGAHGKTELQVTKWDVVNAHVYPVFEDFDGLLISGSKHTAFEDKPWIISLVDYMKDFFANSSKPVVEICFGHQIIARTLGGTVAINPGGWETGVVNIDLTPSGREVFGVSALNMQQVHRDAVIQLPDGVQNIGSSKDCECHGMFKPNRILSFQGHPEFDEPIMTAILKGRYSIGFFSEEQYREGMSCVALPHSGSVLVPRICHFFLDAQ